MFPRKSMNFSNLKFLKNNNLILVVPEGSSFKVPLTEELRNFGFNVKVFDYRENSNFERLVLLLSFVYKPLKNRLVGLRNKRLIKEVKEFKPSIVFVSKGEVIDSETINVIKNQGAITINWFSDWFHGFKNYKQMLSTYDYVFTADKFDTELHRGIINVYHLPYGAWSINKKINFSKRKYNLTFVGVWTIEREEMMYTLKEFKPLIWGNESWAKGKMKDFYQKEWLNPEGVLQVLADSKITINQSQWDAQLHTTLNMRAFEATANGALVLTDFRSDLPALFKYSGNKKEVVLFSDYEELRKQVGYYLKNNNKRIEIAKRGYQRAMKDYNYLNRIDKIFKVIAHDKKKIKKAELGS